MSDPFLGEIRMAGFPFAPRGWAYCDGSLVSTAQNPALFALLSTTYGGDGPNVFGLPDLRGRSPVGVGSGPNLSPVNLGDKKGVETITLQPNQMPAHTHTVSVAGTPVDATAVPTFNNNVLGASTGGPGSAAIWSTALNNPVALTPSQVSTAGEGWPVATRNPYLGLTFMISMEGIFPTRP